MPPTKPPTSLTSHADQCTGVAHICKGKSCVCPCKTTPGVAPVWESHTVTGKAALEKVQKREAHWIC